MAINLWILYSVSFIVCSVLNIKSTTAQFPNFSIQANDSFSAIGDTVVIKCLVYNVTVIDIMNGYDITWFKDDIKLTQVYTRLTNAIITDTRYNISIGFQWNTTISTMQITSITKEDEGLFSCELTNRMNAKERKSISISVEDPEDHTLGSEIAAVGSDSLRALNKSPFTNWTDVEEDHNVTGTPSIGISTMETTDSVNISGKEWKSNIATKTISNTTTLTDTNTTTITNNNTTIQVNNSITTPADSNITTPADSSITTPLLVSTDNNMETGIEKREDNKDGVIAGVIIVVLVLLVVAIFMCDARRRNKLNCDSCYHKRKDISRKGNSPPREETHEYVNINTPFSHPDYQNPEPKFVTNNRRRPYEDANTNFVTEYEIKKDIFGESHNHRNGGTGMDEQTELSGANRNASDQNLLAPHRSTSDQYLTVFITSDDNLLPGNRNASDHDLSDASERIGGNSLDGQNKPLPKKNKNPYESCNSMDFLKEFA